MLLRLTRKVPASLSGSRSLGISSAKKMPMVTVTTNIADKDVPREFNEKLTHLLAESMNKPVNRIAVLLEAGARFTHGGTFDPAVLVSIRSIGMVTGEDNIRHTERVTKLCNDVLNLPNDKVVIVYYNLTPETVGFNGTTVAVANALAQK